MEDPWGNNAWSATGLEKDGDSSRGVLDPKWNAFEGDADETTIDVGIPSWSAASGSGWGEGTNLWHAESSTLDAWKPSLSSDDTSKEPDLKEEDNAKEPQEGGPSEARPTLPTPPLSPLPVPSVTPPAVETPLSSPPRPLINPPSPDHFGSFESAEVVSEESHDAPAWIPKTPHFTSDDAGETWGGTWGGGAMADAREDKEAKDEWELAHEARRKRDRKVPPELLDSLVKQWDAFATDFHPQMSMDNSESHSWRKGLDSIDGLTELVESFIPERPFPPPTPFNKTAVAQAVKETLRLTRSFAMTQTSPMAHLYASKASADWEKSVKSQKAAANDEWGWDLKHEPAEKLDVTDSSKDKKGGRLLSFWSRKTSSIPSTPAGDSPAQNSPNSPTTGMTKPTSPATSARPSIDSSRIESPTTTSLSDSTAPAAIGDTAVSADIPSAQPSAVSRFFNRFSRKPTAASTVLSGNEKPTSLSLSFDDLSFLSDITPSTSEGSLQSQRESAPVNSRGGILSWPKKNSSPTSGKLPPPLGPPPSSRLAGHRPTGSQGSVNSFDTTMADAQLMDVLDKVMGAGPSSRSGYAPVTIDSVDFLESPVEGKTPLPALQSPEFPKYLTSTKPSVQPPGISLISTSSFQTPVSSPIIPLSLTASNARDSPMSTHLSIAPIPSPHIPHGSSMQQSIASARVHNSLPPTPKRGLGDFANFVPTSPSSGRSTPPRSPLLSQPGSSSSTKLFATTSLLSEGLDQSDSLPTLNMDDSVDFGEFISTPIRTPSPPKVPQKTFLNHEAAFELVESAASRQGRWPAPPSPSPQPLAPPPGPASHSGYFNKHPRQPPQLDLLTSDNSPAKGTSISENFSMSGQDAGFRQPLFAGPLSRPASTRLGMSPAALPLMTSQTSTPSLPPNPALSKPTGASGLSAQDLSFFESL